MKQHYVYVLFSKRCQRTYVGETASPEQRLKQHNAGKVRSEFFSASRGADLFVNSPACAPRRTLKIQSPLNALPAISYEIIAVSRELVAGNDLNGESQEGYLRLRGTRIGTHSKEHCRKNSFSKL
jgi:hypothetical protein